MIRRRVLAYGSLLTLFFFLAVPSSYPQSWALTGSLQHDRQYHTATLLQNGNVLVTGGVNNDGQTMALAELYFPATGTWSFTGSLNHDRKYHTATLLQNGKVLIAGGENNDGQPMALCELYNPATGTFSFTGSLHQARSLHTATSLQSGVGVAHEEVLVAGGFIQSKETDTTASAEIYDTTTGTWSLVGSLVNQRARATATLIAGNQVLVVAGVNNSNSPINTVELYSPAIGGFSPARSLNQARVWHTATLMQDGQTVLVAGGQDANGNPVSLCELYNPFTNIWNIVGPLNQARSFHTATLLQNGMVVAAGGYVGAGLRNTTATSELFNPATGTWSVTANLPHDLARATAVLLQNGQVLVAAGVNNDGSTINIAELFTF